MHPPGMTGYVLRSLQWVFSVIVLSLAAALVANQPTGGSPSQINYSVFVGVFRSSHMVLLCYCVNHIAGWARRTNRACDSGFIKHAVLLLWGDCDGSCSPCAQLWEYRLYYDE